MLYMLQNLSFTQEMDEVELSDNLTELLNLSGYCGNVLSSEDVETINYYRQYFDKVVTKI